MENENMDYENEVMDPEVETTEVDSEETGMSTGMAMLIGAGLTVAVTAAIKLGKKVVAKFKAKKELEAADEENFAIPDDENNQDITK